MKSFTSRRFRETYANLPSQFVGKLDEHIGCFGRIPRTPA